MSSHDNHHHHHHHDHEPGHEFFHACRDFLSKLQVPWFAYFIAKVLAKYEEEPTKSHVSTSAEQLSIAELELRFKLLRENSELQRLHKQFVESKVLTEDELWATRKIPSENQNSRDSKLTRLLRDSLEGKTKNCIIATISPPAHSLDETLSTLDYAYRAKNIKNKAETNQKLSKVVLPQDLYLELERMKEDGKAARDKNGVYIGHERYTQEEAEQKARIERIEQFENELSLSETEVSKFSDLYEIEKQKLLDVESDLKDCKVIKTSVIYFLDYSGS